MTSVGESRASGQTLWIARHGNRRDFEDVEWRQNAERKDDPPLSESGVQQAGELAERLVGEGILHIFASPFLRAVQTAAIVADILDLPIKIEHGVCEWLRYDWFPPDGPSFLPPVEMARRFPRVDTRYRSLHHATYPEDRDEMRTRTDLAITRLTKQYPEDLLIIGHGATVMAVCEETVVNPPEKVTAPCCSLTKIVRRPEGWYLELQGDRSHLSEPRTNDGLP